MTVAAGPSRLGDTFRRLKFAAAGLLMAAVAACSSNPSQPAAAAPPGPAMWVIRDADSTIYLFGTIHVLKPETQWRSPRIDAAIASAAELWLEVPMNSPEEMAAQMMPLMMKYGMSTNGRTLSSRLTPDEMKTLTEAAGVAGLPVQALEMFRPWFAALAIQASSLTKAGYDPNAGVDFKLSGIFKERGIPARGLETIEDQMGIFANMGEEAELAFLRETLKEYRNAETVINAMAAQWAAGDTAGMEKDIVGPMKADPAQYEALLVRRNANWTVKIEEMLKGSGTVFIAVGAGHLVGPDSVQAMLARKGIRATRS